MVVEAWLNFGPPQEQVVFAVGLLLCGVVLVLLTRRQIAAVAPRERWKFPGEGVLVLVLLAAYWIVIGVQIWMIVQ